MLDEPIDLGEIVWPENWLAVQVFCVLSTQWRMAPSGHMIGLDYAAIPPALELLDIARPEWPEIFAGVRVMEYEALNETNKRNG